MVVEMSTGRALRSVKPAAQGPERVVLVGRIDGSSISPGDIKNTVPVVQGKGVQPVAKTNPCPSEHLTRKSP